ncbi:acylglycerol kinase family protein [Qipengyuania sp. SS22]|uniref:diacylglycerol/lipid kinase family protein n=1 Tax=Qipengyuania sp. SS22 TaxID=2979461 RepID=UPI0021E5F15E|nr:acylglycerol kinase family protein [Qipengyuania sp. SS22]UYH54570.1 acylglycerol kinase family protein [Qipengyuania sp. SS22]
MGTAGAIRRLIDMAPLKSWLIVNSRSGSNSEAALVALERSLAAYAMPTAETIAFPAEELPTRTVLESADVARLIVFTGDGTLNAVIEAVAGWSGEVLVLPGGTMNLLSARLHGPDTDYDAILERIARGAFRPVRPKMACCSAGRAHAGVLVGPGTAWAEVREAMRDFDVAGLAQGTSEALAETTGGSRVKMVEPAIGHDDGYPLIELTPSHRGIQVDGFRIESAGEFLQQSWALLRRSFRKGPHERLGLLDRLVIENCAGEPIEVLIDGEPAKLGSRAEFTVEDCPVDLLATAHGF